MLHLLILVICNSLLCLGLYNAFQYELNDKGEVESKEILWFWKYYVLDVVNYDLSKPLGNCLMCMASIYSVIPYWWYVGWDVTFLENWLIYPFYILMVSGLNRLIFNVVEG